MAPTNNGTKVNLSHSIFLMDAVGGVLCLGLPALLGRQDRHQNTEMAVGKDGLLIEQEIF